MTKITVKVEEPPLASTPISTCMTCVSCVQGQEQQPQPYCEKGLPEFPRIGKHCDKYVAVGLGWMECMRNHTPSPDSYIEWHAWAEKMGKTHKQVKCPGCGRYAIWVPKQTRGG